MILAALDKFINNVFWRNRPVHEDKVFMLNAVLLERSFVIFRIVKADDLAHLQMLEDVNIAAS